MFPLYQSLYKHLPPPPPTSMPNGLMLPVPEHHLPGNPDLSSKTAESSYDTSNIFAAAMAWHQHSMLRSNSSPSSLGENLLYSSVLCFIKPSLKEYNIWRRDVIAVFHYYRFLLKSYNSRHLYFFKFTQRKMAIPSRRYV